MSCFKLKLFSFTAIKWLFLTFYFEIIIDLQEVAKTVREVLCTFPQLVLVVRSYAAIQYNTKTRTAVLARHR